MAVSEAGRELIAEELIKQMSVDPKDAEKAGLIKQAIKSNPKTAMKVLREYYRAESKHSSSLLKVYRDLHFGIEQVDRQLREEKKISQLYNEMLELERSNVLQIRKLRCNPRLDRVDVAALGNFISIEKGSADHKMLEKAQGIPLYAPEDLPPVFLTKKSPRGSLKPRPDSASVSTLPGTLEESTPLDRGPDYTPEHSFSPV